MSVIVFELLKEVFMKTAVLLTIVALGAGTAAWMAPAPARSAALDVPEVTLIGQSGTSGSVRVVLTYREFDKDPNVDVHTTAKNVTIKDLTLFSNGTGTGIAQFTLSYTTDTDSRFSVEVTAHDGTKGGGKNHLVSKEIVVQRK